MCWGWCLMVAEFGGQEGALRVMQILPVVREFLVVTPSSTAIVSPLLSPQQTQPTTNNNKQQVGSINSPALVKALFDIYVGPDPVSSEAKRSFGKGLAALLNE